MSEIVNKNIIDQLVKIAIDIENKKTEKKAQAYNWNIPVKLLSNLQNASLNPSKDNSDIYFRDVSSFNSFVLYLDRNNIKYNGEDIVVVAPTLPSPRVKQFYVDIGGTFVYKDGLAAYLKSLYDRAQQQNDVPGKLISTAITKLIQEANELKLNIPEPPVDKIQQDKSPQEKSQPGVGYTPVSYNQQTQEQSAQAKNIEQVIGVSFENILPFDPITGFLQTSRLNLFIDNIVKLATTPQTQSGFTLVFPILNAYSEQLKSILQQYTSVAPATAVYRQGIAINVEDSINEMIDNFVALFAPPGGKIITTGPGSQPGAGYDLESALRASRLLSQAVLITVKLLNGLKRTIVYELFQEKIDFQIQYGNILTEKLNDISSTITTMIGNLHR